MENANNELEGWKTKLNGRVIVGRKDFIEKSIDWWCDRKAELSESDFKTENKEREIIEFNGVKIINDNGKENEWYMILRGNLYKGKKISMMKKIELQSKQKNARKRIN